MKNDFTFCHDNSSRSMYSNKIDFEEASHEWRKNKKALPSGAFVYRCAHIVQSTQELCKRQVFGKSNYCKQHLKKHIHP